MEKEFLDYTEALELKAIGFDEPCFAFFNGTHLSFSRFDTLGKLLDIGKCLEAPTFSQSFRWFREKYGLYSCIMYSSDGIIKGGYSPMIDIMKPHKAILDFNNYDTFEEAELECLKKLIKIVKEK
jgi:hypothetical protein